MSFASNFSVKLQNLIHFRRQKKAQNVIYKVILYKWYWLIFYHILQTSPTIINNHDRTAFSSNWKGKVTPFFMHFYEF